MPMANENCVKVYLYGLYYCGVEGGDATIEHFSNKLNLSVEDVISSFMFWEDLGLVSLVSKDPMQVRYMPVSHGSTRLKKFNVNKYRKFNITAQEILNGRVLSPTEYQEYYWFMESRHVERDAFLMIIKYCANQKGNDVNYPYILKVASNWAHEGVKTCKDVEEKLLFMQNNQGEILDIIKALGLRRSHATDEEYKLYFEWTKEMNFSLDIIMAVAAKNKNKRGGFNRVNAVLEKCYSLGLNSRTEIIDHLNNEEEHFALAKDIARTIGVRYENYESVVDNYIINWVALGFDAVTLKQIAVYCFKTSIRTLEGMHERVNSLFKAGLVTEQSIKNHISQTNKTDASIKAILSKLGIERMVVSSDRMLYQTWTNTWQHSAQLIDYAITLSVGKEMPLAYLNKILSTYFFEKITTVDAAKKLTSSFGGKKSKTVTSAKKPEQRSYSASQLNSLFDDITEVEVLK